MQKCQKAWSKAGSGRGAGGPSPHHLLRRRHARPARDDPARAHTFHNAARVTTDSRRQVPLSAQPSTPSTFKGGPQPNACPASPHTARTLGTTRSELLELRGRAGRGPGGSHHQHFEHGVDSTCAGNPCQPWKSPNFASRLEPHRRGRGRTSHIAPFRESLLESQARRTRTPGLTASTRRTAGPR